MTNCLQVCFLSGNVGSSISGFLQDWRGGYDFFFKWGKEKQDKIIFFWGGEGREGRERKNQ